MMIEKIRKSFNDGVANLRWLANFLAERTRAETSIFKLRYESSKLENRIDELYRDVGKRVLEIKEKEEKDVFKDFIILQTIDEIKALRKEIDDYSGKEEEFKKIT
ncbi:MAG: hypothetical protein HY807_07315 [Nitrospirae bacterium]|nr:hypothetical protein [Nitrospirota bacterium]